MESQKLGLVTVDKGLPNRRKSEVWLYQPWNSTYQQSVFFTFSKGGIAKTMSGYFCVGTARPALVEIFVVSLLEIFNTNFLHISSVSKSGIAKNYGWLQ